MPLFPSYAAHNRHPASGWPQESRQAEEEEKEKGEGAFGRGGERGSAGPPDSPRATASRLFRWSSDQRGAWGWYQHSPPPPASAEPSYLQGGAQGGASTLGWPRHWRRGGKGTEGGGLCRKQNGVPPGETGGVQRRGWVWRGWRHHGRLR